MCMCVDSNTNTMAWKNSYTHTHTLHMPERIRTKTRMVWAIKIVFCFIAHMLLSIYGLAWCYLNKLFGSAHLSAKYSPLYFCDCFPLYKSRSPFLFHSLARCLLRCLFTCQQAILGGPQVHRNVFAAFL